MSRIVSISESAPASRRATSAPRQRQQRALVVSSAPAHRARAHYRTSSAAAKSAFTAQLLAGAPRRGLRASPDEQARIFAAYVRTQSPRRQPGQSLRSSF